MSWHGCERNKTSRNAWKTIKKTADLSNAPLCLESFEQTPPYHTYSVGHIWLFVTLVLSAVASFRGASRTLETVLSLQTS